jgi:hypothetical protein
MAQYQRDEEVRAEKMSAFAASLACPPLISVTVKDIHAACQVAYSQGGPGGTCSPELLENAIEGFQQKLQRSLLADLMKMHHEVAYPQKNSRQLDSTRIRRLKALVAVPRLQQTRFMLATSARPGAAGEAAQRLKLVSDWLVANGIPEEKVEKPLTYNFFKGQFGFSSASGRLKYISRIGPSLTP